jgi:hypothetical protein
MTSRYSDSRRKVKTSVSAIVKPRGAKVAPVRNKALGPELNDAARKFIKEVVKSDFDNNTSRAAKALHISQSMLYEFLEGKRGAGMKLLSGVAAYRGVSVDVVIGRAGGSDGFTGGRRLPPELISVLEASEYLPETKAQLGLYASFVHDALPQDEWTRIGDGYDRENRSAKDRAELAKLRARKLPMSPPELPGSTKRPKA